MKIRQVTIADVPALVALNRMVQAMHVEAFPDKFRRNPPDEVVLNAFKEEIQSQTSCWLLAEAERAVAFLSSEFRQRAETCHLTAQQTCYISRVVVEPDCRRKGVARTLLAALKQEARSRGVIRIELDVWTFNAEAKRAFASLGFHPVMERMALSQEHLENT